MTPKAFVTGATGFIGSHVVRHLLRQGWSVTVLVRPTSITSAWGEAGDAISLSLYDGTGESLYRALEQARPDVVLHLATHFLARHVPGDLEALIDGNIRLGLHLADAMARTECRRLVTASTSWQHGNHADHQLINLYTATKQAGDALFAYYRDAADLRQATLTLFDTYGPGDTRRKIIPLLREAWLTGRTLDLSPGTQRLDFLHVRDVAAAFGHAAEGLLATDGATLATGEYAVQSGTAVSLRELVALIESIVGRALPVRWGVHPFRPREVMEPWAGGRRLPGWQPEIGLRAGMTELFAEMPA